MLYNIRFRVVNRCAVILADGRILWGLPTPANSFELGEKDCRVGVCWF